MTRREENGKETRGSEIIGNIPMKIGEDVEIRGPGGEVGEEKDGDGMAGEEMAGEERRGCQGGGRQV